MKYARILTAGIFGLSLVFSLTACSSDPTSSNSTTGSSSTSNALPPAGEDEVPEFKTQKLTAFAYTPYETQFSIVKENASQDIAISNNVYKILSPGTYTLSGNLVNGRIEVKKEIGAVNLVLNNVSISGIDAAIWLKKSNSVTITAASGSLNYFKDGSAEQFAKTFISEKDDEPKGTIFAKCPLTIDGSGSIFISSTAVNIPYTASGITSYHNINGLHVKNDLTIDGPKIFIDSVNNGIKTKGALNISNAAVEIKAADDGISTDYENSAALDTNVTGIMTLENNTIVVEAKKDALQAEYGIIGKSGSYYLTAGENGSAGQPDSESHKGLKTSYADSTDLSLSSTITVEGGEFYIDSLDDGLHSTDDIHIHGGLIAIKSADDGIHADNNLVIDEGNPNVVILTSYEGLEALDIIIDTGFCYIVSSDDGINAAGGNDASGGQGQRPGFHNRGWGGGFGPGHNNPGTTDNAVLTINGGAVVVQAGGDGIDSNGKVNINGGVTIVNADVSRDDTSLDFDGACTVQGGTFIVAGSSGMLEYPTSVNQPVLCASSTTHFENSTYYGIFDSSNNLIAAFKSPFSTSSIFFSSPDLAMTGTYSIYGGGTYSGGKDYFGLVTGGTYAGGSRLSLKK